jgi:hypothetical protein
MYEKASTNFLVYIEKINNYFLCKNKIILKNLSQSPQTELGRCSIVLNIISGENPFTSHFSFMPENCEIEMKPVEASLTQLYLSPLHEMLKYFCLRFNLAKVQLIQSSKLKRRIKYLQRSPHSKVVCA